MTITTNKDPEEVVRELVDEARPFPLIIIDRLGEASRESAGYLLGLLLEVRVDSGHDELIEAVGRIERIEIIGNWSMDRQSREVTVDHDFHCLNDRVVAKLEAEKAALVHETE